VPNKDALVEEVLLQPYILQRMVGRFDAGKVQVLDILSVEDT
jgi:hypothetical protein